MSSSSTSHGYFDSVITQLSLSVGSSFEDVAGNSAANASEGVSAGVSAVDMGMKAGMALAEARNEHAIVSFRYDNMGLPVEERSNEHVIKRTYDKSGQIATLTSSLGANLTYERNEQGEIEEYQKDLRTWLFEEESFVPLALFQDGKAYSIVTDHLGTPVEAYNEQGEEVWYRRLDMNGKVIEERSMLYTSYKDYIKIPFLFQGQYYDEEIKLAYNRFRYYSPDMGMYISSDPIGLAGGFNTYAYVKDTNTWVDVLRLSGELVYQLIRDNKVVYYDITSRTALERMAEHGKTKVFDNMEILADGLTHDQARSIEGALIRQRLKERADDWSDFDSIKARLDKSGLDNRNRGRIKERWTSENPLDDLRDKIHKKQKKVKVGCKS